MNQVIDVPATALVEYQRHEAIVLPDRASMQDQLRRVREFQRLVQELFIEGHDFGTIPGTGNRKTMLKPGAEKTIKLLGLADTYDFLDRVEDWQGGFFNYTVRCRLVSMATGEVVSEGLGNCNSYESKYRYRWAWPSDIPEAERVGLKTRTIRTSRGPTTQYRIENEDPADQVNTIIKMAKKRACVDAALSAGRLSDVFTQDLEDQAPGAREATIPDAEPSEAPPAPAPKPAPSSATTAPPAQNGAPVATRAETGIFDTRDPLWAAWLGVVKIAVRESVQFQPIPEPSTRRPVPIQVLDQALADLRAQVALAVGDEPTEAPSEPLPGFDGLDGAPREVNDAP